MILALKEIQLYDTTDTSAITDTYDIRDTGTKNYTGDTYDTSDTGTTYDTGETYIMIPVIPALRII